MKAPQQTVYSRARKARDPRFDGVFFTAVKTTGIYCRPICPATSPLEKNVEYHLSAISAAQAGFRPCLRCRPDSSPSSNAWLGTETTFQRALSMIQQGALHDSSIEQLAARLGISDRYLRDLFHQNLGTSPKKYAIYQQCLLAKQLLHQTRLSMSDVAFACGFNSVRRFNEAMREQLKLTPTDIRKTESDQLGGLKLKLHYRPPYAWQKMLNFLERRVIAGLEWSAEGMYGRTVQLDKTNHRRDNHRGKSRGGESAKGYFTIQANPDQHCFELDLHLDSYRNLSPIIQRIRNLFDVDAPIADIDSALKAIIGDLHTPGLRVPGIWGAFETGVRAVLGQQVSVVAAQNLVTTMSTF